MPTPDTIRLILILLSCCLVLATILRPALGVTGYMIIMVTRPGLFWPLLEAIRIELMVGVGLLVFIFLSGRFRRLTISEPINKYMFLLFGIILLSMMQAFSFSRSLIWTIDFAKVMAFYIMVVTMLDSKNDVKLFLWFFSILMMVLGYIAVYNYQAGVIVEAAAGSDRVGYATANQGMGAGHVALASLVLQGMPFILFLGLASKRLIIKAAGISFMPLCVYAVIVSGSRGGLVGLAVFYLLLLLVLKGQRKLVLVVGIVGVLILPAIAPGGYFEYMKSILGLVTGGGDVSGRSRIDGLRHGFEMMVKRPILGVGPGCYPLARKAWMGWYLWSHNHYGQLMGDLGIIGTAVWFLFLKSYFMRAWRFLKEKNGDPTLRNVCQAVVVATIVRLAIGMGTHSLYIFFWYMMAGIMVSAYRISEQR